MPSKPKCYKCGATSVHKTAICQKCHSGFSLCKGCANEWKTRNCPACGAGFADWVIV